MLTDTKAQRNGLVEKCTKLQKKRNQTRETLLHKHRSLSQPIKSSGVNALQLQQPHLHNEILRQVVPADSKFNGSECRRGSRGGGGRWARRPPLGRVPSSQGQKEGILVSLEWLFNTIQT